MMTHSSGLQEISLHNIAGNFSGISGKLNNGTGNYKTRNMWRCSGVRACQNSLLCECHQQRRDLNSRYVHFTVSRKRSSIEVLYTMGKAMILVCNLHFPLPIFVMIITLSMLSYSVYLNVARVQLQESTAIPRVL
jgi:hypothetical protein